MTAAIPATPALDPGLRSAAAPPRLADPAGPRVFEAALRGAGAAQRRAAARDAASRLVSTTFVAPLLRSLHDSPFAAEPFSANFAARQFRPLLDQQLADRVTGAADLRLVDAIVERLLGPRPAAGPRPGDDR